MKGLRKENLLPVAVIAGAVLAGGTALVMAAEEWKAPARAAQKKNPVPADDDSISRGKESYEAQCNDCHGATGKGDGPKAKELKEQPKDLGDPLLAKQSDGELFWKISEGKKPMPAGKKLMSDDEIWDIVNYVRTFGKK